jgi:cyclophilin family peptidyl-prolyl cis-trans isomerase
MSSNRNVSLTVINLAICLLFAGCSGSATTANTEAERGILPTGPKKAEFNDQQPQALIRTSLGDLTVELDAANAPIAVDNFLAYAARKHYDGTIFHQIEAGYIVLGGGFDAELSPRKAQFPIRNEAHHGQKNVRGTLAMARAPDAIDSATDQFFINLADNANLDHSARTPEGYGYCVFGKVVAGEDVLANLGQVSVASQPEFPNLPTTPVVIESIRRIR